MALPIIEDIAVNILAAINAITTVNGFEHTLVAIRPRLTNYADVIPEDKVVMITQTDEIKLNEASLVITWQQTFELICWAINSDKLSTTLETKANQIRADIQKKLVEDVERNGNADDTEILSSEVFNGDEGSGVRIQVAVRYKVSATDPYTKG